MHVDVGGAERVVADIDDQPLGGVGETTEAHVQCGADRTATAIAADQVAGAEAGGGAVAAFHVQRHAFGVLFETHHVMAEAHIDAVKAIERGVEFAVDQGLVEGIAA